MVKKALKDQLGTTLKNVDKGLKDRIARADEVFLNKATISSTFQSNADDNKAVRDNFTIPVCDLNLLDSLRTRFAAAGEIMNKSEVIRAGLHALSILSNEELKDMAKRIVKLRQGRSNSKVTR